LPLEFFFVDEGNPFDINTSNGNLDIEINPSGSGYELLVNNANEVVGDQQTEITLTANPFPQCEAVNQSFDISFLALPDLGAFSDNRICFGDEITYQPGADTDVITMSFEGGETLSFEDVGNDDLVFSSENLSETDEAQLTLLSSQGCQRDATVELLIRQNPDIQDAIVFSIDGVEDNSFCTGDENIEVEGPEGFSALLPFDYTWNADGLTLINEDDNTIVIQSIDDNPAMLAIEAAVDYGNGFVCVAEETIEIQIEGERCDIEVFGFPGGVFVAKLDSIVNGEQPQFDWITPDDLSIASSSGDLLIDSHIFFLAPETNYTGDLEVRASYYDNSRCKCSFLVERDNIAGNIGGDVRSYPNPIHQAEALSIVLPEYFIGDDVVLRFFDSAGRLCYENSYPETQAIIELNLPYNFEGTYMVQLISPAHVASDKIVVR